MFMLYDLVIVGGGPAAVSAGIYASRQNIKTLLIAKSFGGQVAKKAVAIENYPGFKKISGSKLFGKFEKHLQKQKIEILADEVERVKKKESFFEVFTAGGKSFQAKAVIVATGGDPRLLDVPGEKEFLGRGVSYCTVCDGPLFKGKTVAVIGGGNSGFEAAIFLSKIAQKVYILERRDKALADGSLQKKIKKSGNVEVIVFAKLKEIQGLKFVKSIIYENQQDKKEAVLAVDGVFAEIGYVPVASFLSNDLVDLNSQNEIKINCLSCQTKTPGLFAAGDATETKYKQIIIAAGEGAKAALSAYEYLERQKKS
ncbi:MAG: FAD-dependent oxidoreductase [bacterium]